MAKRRIQIIKIHVESRTYYFCLRHTFMVRDEVENAIKGLEELERLREWLVRKAEF